MGEALIAAARDAGLQICLLDTCYLAGGFDPSTGSGHRSPEGVQVRFSDGDAERWAVRVADLAARHAEAPDVVIGAAIHSVRAVPRDQLRTVATALPAAPLHVHVSEQPAENADCRAATGLTPVQLLAEAGVWTTRTTAVHAIHLSDGDVSQLGAAEVVRLPVPEHGSRAGRRDRAHRGAAGCGCAADVGIGQQHGDRHVRRGPVSGDAPSAADRVSGGLVRRPALGRRHLHRSSLPRFPRRRHDRAGLVGPYGRRGRAALGSIGV